MRTVLKVIFATATVVGLTSCVTSRYDGPGTQKQFLAARYQCLLEVQNISTAYGGYGQFGGGLSVTTGPSCGALASCMAVKGYTMDENGKFSVPPDQYVRCVR